MLFYLFFLTLIAAVALFWRAFVDLLPVPPGWVSTGSEYLGGIWELLMAFQEWIPVPVAFAVAGWIIACNFLMVLFKAFRVGVSYATFGGGAVSD